MGDFAASEPMVLGHEVVGRVAALGPGVEESAGTAVGAAVAIHPATPCGACRECVGGRRNVCAHTRYLGSAVHTPHVQGGFSRLMHLPADRSVPCRPG